MEPTPIEQAKYALLYLLTDNTKYLTPVFPRKRGIIKHMKVSSPPLAQPKPKKLRNHCPNAYMDIVKAHKRFMDEGVVNSHSHRIGHIVKVNGFRLMSNVQKLPVNTRELPYHRPFEPGEQPNVGPQPVRN